MQAIEQGAQQMCSSVFNLVSLQFYWYALLFYHIYPHLQSAFKAVILKLFYDKGEPIA